MALGATMRRFTIALADADRGVYEALDWRVAQHPSENERYLTARVIARALEHAEGVDFTRGLSTTDEPAIWQKDLTGVLQTWIEIGVPTTDRLHRAQKACKRVAVYGWKQLDELAEAAREIHRAEELEVYTFDPTFLDALAATLDRTNTWDLSVTGGTIYVTVGAATFEGAATRIPVGE